jgi:DNA-binding response OmpR family regulator
MERTRSPKVLVVDDEECVRRTLVRFLECEGYAVDTAEDGHQALERLRQDDYGCVVLDLRMPGMDGLGLYEAVKACNPGLAGRIVFCTGESASPHISWFLEWSGNRILRKPFHMDQLLEACSEACRT